ncbi:MAG TPA: MarR family winged helix-turn-helix transcriptional regulator, partial [Thermoleophilaceae bacterium]
SPDCLTADLGWLLGQAKHALSAEYAAALEPLGLSPRDYFVLATALGEDHTQIGLAKLIGMDKTTMVVTIDALEKAGWAERRPSSTDRRVRVIAVTKAGERKVAQARKLIDQVQCDILERLPLRERKGLLQGLSSLVAECNAHGPAR